MCKDLHLFDLLLTLFKTRFLKQLTPIEKYALNYLELFHTPIGPEKEGSGEVSGSLLVPSREGLGFRGRVSRK